MRQSFRYFILYKYKIRYVKSCQKIPYPTLNHWIFCLLHFLFLNLFFYQILNAACMHHNRLCANIFWYVYNMKIIPVKISLLLNGQIAVFRGWKFNNFINYLGCNKETTWNLFYLILIIHFYYICIIWNLSLSFANDFVTILQTVHYIQSKELSSHKCTISAVTRAEFVSAHSE